MKAKPIKHGIKVFACCCVYKGLLLSFTVYVGKDNTAAEDANTTSICDNLITKAKLTNARGGVLVTDNYYTTVKLAIHMWVKYGWTNVGTIIGTDKVTRTDHDIPFLKLTEGAWMECRRGWFWEAVLCVTNSGKELWIQATTWRDKKQVMFLTTNRVGASSGNTVSWS